MKGLPHRCSFRAAKPRSNLTDGTSTLKTNSILSDSNAISTTTTLSFVNDTATAPAALSGASDITAGATVQDLVDGLNAIAGVRAEFDNNTGDLTVYSDEDFHITDGSVTATLGSFAFDASALTATTQLLSETGSFAVGDTLTLTDGNGYELGSLEIESDTTVADLESFADDFQGVSADFDHFLWQVVHHIGDRSVIDQ